MSADPTETTESAASAPRTYAVGDVHGRLDLLRRAVDAISEHVGDGPFRVVFLGDYVDRGPDSRGVIDFLMALQRRWPVVCLKGNHEELMIQAIADPASRRLERWLEYGGDETLRSYGLGKDDALTGASCSPNAFRAVQSTSMDINAITQTLSKLPAKTWAIQAVDYATGHTAAANFTKAAQAIRTGDIAGARLVLERAQEGGDVTAIYALAQTFDPRVLQQMRVQGLKGDATKARLLLMACLMKFGSLPPATDPDYPTSAEAAAIGEKIALYQAVFDTH